MRLCRSHWQKTHPTPSSTALSIRQPFRRPRWVATAGTNLQQAQRSYNAQSNNNATASALVATSATANHYQQDAGNFWKSSVAAASMLLGVAALGLVQQSQQTTFCEEKPQLPEKSEENNDGRTSKNEDNSNSNQYEIGPDDPYYEVPEEDEPTDCQMCLTFRQGPCRTEWKRFEMCAKDKNPSLKEEKKEGDSNTEADADKKEKEEEDKEESDALACMKYAMPFYECSSKYVNTYILLGNEQTFQKVIYPLHDAFSSDEAKSRRLCWAKNPTIDWKQWEYFVSKVEEIGGGIPTKFRLENTGFNSPAEALKASWNKDGPQYLMMDNENEPYLISVSAQVPKKQGDDQTLLMTYALDQHGNLIGDKRYDEEDETKEAEEKAKEGKDAKLFPNVDMNIQLLPGVTESITIYGLYVPSNEADFLTEGKLYESKPYAVPTTTSKTETETEKKPKKQTKKKKKKKATNKKKESEDDE